MVTFQQQATFNTIYLVVLGYLLEREIRAILIFYFCCIKVVINRLTKVNYLTSKA